MRAKKKSLWRAWFGADARCLLPGSKSVVCLVAFGVLSGLLWSSGARAGVGQHPYFSKHAAAYKTFKGLLKATRQLKPVPPKRFDLGLRLSDHRGQMVSFGRFRGKVLLLTRWATWCKACKAELPGKLEIPRRLNDARVVTVGISFQAPALIKRYHRTAPKKAIFPLSLLDPTGKSYPYLSDRFLPITLVIDPWGWIVAKRIGPGLWSRPTHVAVMGFLLKRFPGSRVPLARQAPRGRPGHRVHKPVAILQARPRPPGWKRPLARARRKRRVHGAIRRKAPAARVVVAPRTMYVRAHQGRVGKPLTVNVLVRWKGRLDSYGGLGLQLPSLPRGLRLVSSRRSKPSTYKGIHASVLSLRFSAHRPGRYEIPRLALFFRARGKVHRRLLGSLSLRFLGAPHKRAKPRQRAPLLYTPMRQP